MVVAAYMLYRHPGWTVMFEHGDYDGWNPCDAGLFAAAFAQARPVTDPPRAKESAG